MYYYYNNNNNNNNNNNTIIISVAEDLDDFRRVLGLLLGMQTPNTRCEPLDLVREAAHGNVEKVQAIIGRFPGQVCLVVCFIS